MNEMVAVCVCVLRRTNKNAKLYGIEVSLNRIYMHIWG